MEHINQKFLYDLDPGETVIFDGIECWFVGIIDGKAYLWPKESVPLTCDQFLALNERMKKHPEGITFAEYRAIINGEIESGDQPNPPEKHPTYFDALNHLYLDHLDSYLKESIRENGKTTEQAVFLHSSQELKSGKTDAAARKWWVRSPGVLERSMEGSSWYSQAANKYGARIVEKMKTGMFYLQQLFSTAFLEFDSLQNAEDCKAWAERNPEKCGVDPIALVDTTVEESRKHWENFINEE